MNRIEKKLSGHIRIGPITIYGFNAMKCAINIKTKRWGYICLCLPGRLFGKRWGWYFYLSPNATPWASTLCFGPGVYPSDKKRARIHRQKWGHGFSVRKHYDEMMRIKNGVDATTTNVG